MGTILVALRKDGFLEREIMEIVIAVWDDKFTDYDIKHLINKFMADRGKKASDKFGGGT